MVIHESFKIQTKKYNEFILITEKLEEAVAKSNIKSGIIYAITNHTTTGITVNESLECLESDLDVMLKRLVPEDFLYSHARVLPTYGATAGNPTGHLKSHLTGNHCVMRIMDGKLDRGSAQEVYFCEFDGPQPRTVCITLMGE